MFGVQRDRILSTAPTILSSCLINVGDTTQRFCGENRIKLSRVRCVIVTSLAPHNASGLPGILLCLSSLVRSLCLSVFHSLLRANDGISLFHP